MQEAQCVEFPTVNMAGGLGAEAGVVIMVEVGLMNKTEYKVFLNDKF